MKIGVVSDTHSHQIPTQLLDDFRKVDLIIHAGDFCAAADLKFFQRIKKVRGVCGNMDGLEIRQVLPERDIFKVEGLKIGIYHGHGAPEQVLKNVKAEFKDDRVDVVIFGHSHHPVNERIGSILFFNPGSPNDIVRAPYCSYGILNIDGSNAVGQIIRVENEHG